MLAHILVCSTLLLQVRTEWVEISQQYHMPARPAIKHPPVTMETVEKTTKRNIVITDNPANRHWSTRVDEQPTTKRNRIYVNNFDNQHLSTVAERPTIGAMQVKRNEKNAVKSQLGAATVKTTTEALEIKTSIKPNKVYRNVSLNQQWIKGSVFKVPAPVAKVEHVRKHNIKVEHKKRPTQEIESAEEHYNKNIDRRINDFNTRYSIEDTKLDHIISTASTPKNYLSTKTPTRVNDNKGLTLDKNKQYGANNKKQHVYSSSDLDDSDSKTEELPRKRKPEKELTVLIQKQNYEKSTSSPVLKDIFQTNKPNRRIYIQDIRKPDKDHNNDTEITPSLKTKADKPTGTTIKYPDDKHTRRIDKYGITDKEEQSITEATNKRMNPTTRLKHNNTHSHIVQIDNLVKRPQEDLHNATETTTKYNIIITDNNRRVDKYEIPYEDFETKESSISESTSERGIFTQLKHNEKHAQVRISKPHLRKPQSDLHYTTEIEPRADLHYTTETIKIYKFNNNNRRIDEYGGHDEDLEEKTEMSSIPGPFSEKVTQATRINQNNKKTQIVQRVNPYVRRPQDNLRDVTEPTSTYTVDNNNRRIDKYGTDDESVEIESVNPYRDRVILRTPSKQNNQHTHIVRIDKHNVRRTQEDFRHAPEPSNKYRGNNNNRPIDKYGLLDEETQTKEPSGERLIPSTRIQQHDQHAHIIRIDKHSVRKPHEDLHYVSEKPPTTTLSQIEENHTPVQRIDIPSLARPENPEFVTKQEFIDDDDAKFLYEDYEEAVDNLNSGTQHTVSDTERVPELSTQSTKYQNEDLSNEEIPAKPYSAKTQSKKNLSSDESKESITMEKKPNPLENVVKFMKVVSETIARSAHKSIGSKTRYLQHLRDNIMMNIEERIDSAWPDDAEARGGGRRTREARGHVEFPSSEGALMTISFLTFAVFLIKLVLQVINTYKNKTMMVSPAVFAVSRATRALRRPPRAP